MIAGHMKAKAINEHAMPYNTEFQILVCKNLKMPVEDIWPLLWITIANK